MKLKFIPIFLFIVTLQAAHSSEIGSTPPPQGKVIYTMNCTFVDDTGKAIGKSQKYILRKGGDGREQMEITSQENAHVPPPIYIQKTSGAYTNGGFKTFYWNNTVRMTVIRGDKTTVEIEFINSPAISIAKATCDNPVYLP